MTSSTSPYFDNSGGTTDDITSSANPWAAGEASAKGRPWSHMVQRAVQRSRALHDPLMSPSASDINIFARKVARRAESSLLESIGEAIASPLPRSVTHMVSVKADDDPGIGANSKAQSAPPVPEQFGDNSSSLLAGCMPSEADGSGAPSDSSRICGLAIRVSDNNTGEYSPSPSIAIPARVGDNVLVMSRSHNGIAISEAGSSPSSSVGMSSYPIAQRTIKMIRHRIQTTETLEGISVHYGVSTSQIKRLNRIWHTNELAIRQHLYIPLRMCSPEYTVDYIEYVNSQYILEKRNNLDPSYRYIDLVEVVLDPASSPSPPENSEALFADSTSLHSRPNSLRKQRWPIVPYESIQKTGPKDIRPDTRKTLTSQQVAALETLRQSGAASERSELRTPKASRVSPKIELMRLKSKAKGNSSIAMDDRIYLCINWKAKSITTFINKTSVIGNAAGQFARQLGVSMLPDVVCRLRIPGTDSDLPSNKRFSEILETDPEPGKTIYNGCTLDLIC
ncbi:hypothetical protein LPJ53_002985 [Coemansia erecta]|uniref:LysM domain-containing protein n=1 Tax=Coemansia erecta TaxID=147472 RepID=A0A9W8CSG0_9FUNG|nr:hypothetical protein LPJ53_002985 [Coemansia erecta]